MLATIDWVTLHDRVGFVIVLAAVLAVLLGLLSLVAPLLGVVLKLYLRLLLLVVVVQVVFGAALYIGGHRPVHEVHYLYGAGMAATLGITFAVSRRTPWPLSKLPLVAGAIIALAFAVLALTSG
jgi:hypothetical protein